MRNISQYDNYKELFTLKRNRSGSRMLFCTNDKAEWFIDVIEYKSKSGEISDSYTIIKSDLEKFRKFNEKNGWFN